MAFRTIQLLYGTYIWVVYAFVYINSICDIIFLCWINENLPINCLLIMGYEVLSIVHFLPALWLDVIKINKYTNQNVCNLCFFFRKMQLQYLLGMVIQYIPFTIQNSWILKDLQIQTLIKHSIIILFSEWF